MNVAEGATVVVEAQPVMLPAGGGTGAALARRASSGADALAAMSEEEFKARLESVEKAQARVRQIQARLMIKGEDYGEIPGTQKPTLLKPGAEKLAAFYGLVATFEVRLSHGDGVQTPPARSFVRCLVHIGSADGPVVGEGYGTASAWESKHRWRTAKRSCPDCGTAGAIAKSKFPDRETGDIGWYCRDCKANYKSDDQAITGQELGRVENADPDDVENTVVKIGKKRAFVDGVLTTTATSGLFTQDLEDGPEGAEEHKGKAPTPQAAQRPASGSPPAGKAPCPGCGKLAPLSKYPKKGSHYCFDCKAGFTPRPSCEPQDQPWDPDEPGADRGE